MSRKLLTFALMVLGAPYSACASVAEGTLDSWQFFGDGFVTSVDDAQLVSEYPGSKGVMLVSPQGFDCERVSLRFDVLPLTPESVLVVMAASSDAGPKSTLSLTDDYDGNIQHLLGQVDTYFFAFHNAAHNRTPFVRRHPFVRGESLDLDTAEDNVMSTRWHSVEASYDSDGLLRLLIDDTVVLEARDQDPLGKGHLALRLRGTTSHVASALFRNVTVTGCDNN